MVEQLPFQTRGTNTTTNFTAEQQQNAQDVIARQACESKGGTWDVEAKTCRFTEEQKVAQTLPKPAVAEAPSPAPTTDPILSLAREKGFSLKVSADILESQANQSRQRQAVRQSVATSNAQSSQLEAQQMLQQQLSQTQTLTAQPTATEPGQPNLFNEVATGATAFGGALAGGKAGLAGGAVLGPAGALIGGIAGAIIGGVGASYVKLSFQKRQDVKEGKNIFSTAKTNRDNILNMVNANLMTEGQARKLWAEEKANIALAHTYLKSQTQNDLNNFLGSPGDELRTVEAYLALEQFYDLEFEKALLAPNPNNLILIPESQEEQ